MGSEKCENTFVISGGITIYYTIHLAILHISFKNRFSSVAEKWWLLIKITNLSAYLPIVARRISFVIDYTIKFQLLSITQSDFICYRLHNQISFVINYTNKFQRVPVGLGFIDRN